MRHHTTKCKKNNCSAVSTDKWDFDRGFIILPHRRIAYVRVMSRDTCVVILMMMIIGKYLYYLPI